jgi:2-polyprenyl-3-methyl-5-hydroxy-6-metoxy-1,4-benzoquinol methylase
MLTENPVTPSDRPECTGERLDPELYPPGETLQEHAARYVFAAGYCRGKCVLDVASGLGYGTDYFRTQGANAVGLELDEKSVQYSRCQYPSSTYVQGSAETMPGQWSEAYDVIVSFETIEHLARPGDFLQEVSRCLRPGGLFICSTPNKSLYIFEGHNPFHTKEFYFGEFLRFIGTRLQVREVFGQSLHPRWQVAFMTFQAMARKVLRALHIPPLGIGSAFPHGEPPSPFIGSFIVEDKILPEFVPRTIPPKCVPGYLVVLAEKRVE